MAKIEIYARLRPSNHKYGGIEVTADSDSGSENILVQPVEQDSLVSTTPSKCNKPRSLGHTFQFKHVFREEANQEEVFDTVAKNVIDSFLEGYNGTIFAYGQTSSGKTYTIEGNGRKFSDRGILPRSLSYLYKEVDRRTSSREDVSVQISYMEIYQDTGYDLLNPGMRPGALMVTLPKINISEGPDGRVIIRNLSTHLAASEEVAHSLLFQGSTCRKVAETSMNQCSSRSHSVFSITLTAKSTDSEIITRSKLNLVDLAGSERVSKTRADGTNLQEAKHINLSLHHLEHVIVTLQTHLKSSQYLYSPLSSPSASVSARKIRDRGVVSPRGSNLRDRLTHNPSGSAGSGSRRGHVPYRNCMLTMVLKDSLGGNCLTAMIATISIEESNLGETISTLRFAQRVACIANKARKNEELDDKAVIRKLKQRIAELENEVLSLKSQQEGRGDYSSIESSTSTSLTDQEKIACHQILHHFFHGKIDNPVIAGINTVAKFNECLHVLKSVVLQALGVSQQSSTTSANTHAKELAIQMKQSFVPLTTPSLNSRLSSGFGSLVDTDKSYDTSHTHIAPSVPAHEQPVLPSPPSVRDQLIEQRIKKKIERHSKHRTPVQSNPQLKLRPYSDHQKLNVRVLAKSPIMSEKSPKHVQRAWMSPTISPSSQSSTITEKNTPAPSLRQERETKQLVCKKEELKRTEREQTKLLNQVQLLDSRVEEEKLRSEMDCIAEQLAMQHAMVTKLQRSASNWDKLCAEKIAEQQLRIKQAKIHQKLMDVCYYIEHSQLLPSSPVPSSSVSLERHPSIKTGRVQKELENHEIKQTQIFQIEQLKISQMEKKLELKEVSTRRKILALKQQLLAGRDATAPSRLHTDTILKSSPQSQSQATQLQYAEPMQAARNHWYQQPSSVLHSAATSSQTVTTTFSTVATVTPQLQYNPQNPLSHTSTATTTTKSNYHQPYLGSPKVDISKTTQPAISSPNSSENCSKARTKQRPVTPSNEKESPPPVQSPPVKLTLPEEVKEAEYMTAVQRQKARVSKIRRCIVAATLIQRAWRTHKRTLVSMSCHVDYDLFK